MCRCHEWQGMHDSGLHANVAAVYQRDAVATVCAGDMGVPEGFEVSIASRTV